MLRIEDSILVIIDVQGRLATLMHNSEILFKNLERIVRGCNVLEVPVIWMEQNPLGLGPTIKEISDYLPEEKPMSKDCFSCCGNDSFVDRLSKTNRKQVLVVGIEAHICVYQTVADLIEKSYEVHLVTDAISSRTQANHSLAVNKMASLGARLTGVEMALFELLKVAGGTRFKQILKLIK